MFGRVVVSVALIEPRLQASCAATSSAWSRPMRKTSRADAPAARIILAVVGSEKVVPWAVMCLVRRVPGCGSQ